MKVLLLHPDDLPLGGPWADRKWDLIVDLGFAGRFVDEEWSRACRARVVSLHQFAGETDGYRWINQILEPARGQLLDRSGLDWWELLSLLSFHEMHGMYLLRQLRAELGSGPIEVAATRPHVYADLLSRMSRVSVHYFESGRTGVSQQVSRKIAAARRLRLSQMIEIALDKWDSTYQFRRRFSKNGKANLQQPAVLLPSAYVNVTRTVLQYSEMFPQRRFLLATTRRSAEAATLPANVSWAPLAAYAPPASQSADEVEAMITRWDAFRSQVLSKTEELAQMRDAGLWDSFPAWLHTGVRVRDAWLALFEHEPISAVLCGDDLNYMTRLPLVLARNRGIRAIAVHHGALDGGCLFKKLFANVQLVKSEMERDYLIRTGNVDPSSIVLGAATSAPATPAARPGGGDLVFFSQPSEVAGARMSEIYRELLPKLCAVAQRTGRRVMVKLHPFESRKDRQRIINAVLPDKRRQWVDIVTAPASAIMRQTWCGVGLDSTVSLECALQGIPYFFCGWLDYNGIGYLQQFARFGAGIVLDSPEEIESIPERVSAYAPDPVALRLLSHFSDPGELENTLFDSTAAASSVAGHELMSNAGR